MNTIREFTGEYRFLSNFWPSPLVIESRAYPTVEHAYQAMKTLDDSERRKIADMPKAGAAKRYGKQVVLRPHWNTIRIPVMLGLVSAKFEDKELGALLAKTGEAKLIEGNDWGDTFWGVCDGEGENHLGHILMYVRDMISAEYAVPI